MENEQLNVDYEKLTRDQFAFYLDITPKAENPTWKLLGFGITEGKINYNNQISTEKWIINKNATSEHESNQKQMPINQKCYKNEPCFEYLNTLRDKTGDYVKGHILEVDIWNGKETDGITKYPTKFSNCITPVSDFLGENAEISYTVYFNGDPTEGTVSIANGTPTFTPDAE